MSTVENQTDSTKKFSRRKKIPAQYIDQLEFDFNIPEAEFLNDGVQKTIRCGFFKWTFSFNNMQTDHEYINQKLKSRINVRKKYGKKKEKKREAKWRKPRQGFLLSAECGPDSETHNLSVSRWKVNAMIVLNLKEPHLVGRKGKRCTKDKDRGWLFTNRVSWHGIKYFPPLAFRLQRGAIAVKLRVLRISSYSPTAFWPDFAEAPFKICLNIGGEHIYIEKTFLEFHSSVLLQQINDGKGLSKENSIRIESRFKPSLIKMALHVICFRAAFYVATIPELLDFATLYGFHTLVQLIERRLITKICAKLRIEQKLDLAYKHQMNGLIVAISKKINKPKEIERHLKMKNIPIQFKTLLKRKMEAIEARILGIEAKSKEKRERKREKRTKGKSRKDGVNAEVKKNLKKLKLSD